MCVAGIFLSAYINIIVCSVRGSLMFYNCFSSIASIIHIEKFNIKYYCIYTICVHSNNVAKKCVYVKSNHYIICQIGACFFAKMNLTKAWILWNCACEVFCYRIFKDTLMTMSEDWYEYSNMYAMIDKAILSHRCSKLIIGIYAMAVLLYSTASFNFHKSASDNNCRPLLIKMALPFGFCESPIYEIVLFVQFIHLMAVASAIGMLDALIVTLVSDPQYFIIPSYVFVNALCVNKCK